MSWSPASFELVPTCIVKQKIVLAYESMQQKCFMPQLEYPGNTCCLICLGLLKGEMHLIISCLQWLVSVQNDA